MPNIVRASEKKVIAILTHASSYEFRHADLFNGFSQYAHEHGNFIIRHYDLSSIDIATAFANCDGIITHAPLGERLEQIKATGLPIVDLTGEHEDDAVIISVDVDAKRIGEMVAERFLQRGFTNFAIFNISDNRFGRHLANGFTTALEQAGHSCTTLLRRQLLTTREEKSLTERQLPKWAAGLPRHTAVFCHHDVMADQLLNACMKIGRDVPGDIAIMGLSNDITVCSFAPVTLSSVDENQRELGYAAMRVLEHVIDHPVRPKKRRTFLVRPGEIYERESTTVYPIDPPWLANILLKLDENINRDFTTPELAKMAGISQSTLQTAFNKAFGMSAGKYMNAIRMREAKRLIGLKKFSIKEVTAMMNFSSSNYFSYAYELFFGHPPSVDLRK